MNIQRTPEIVKKRLELSEKFGWQPLVTNIVEKTQVSTDTVLCYLSREPTELGSELKSLMIVASNFLWQSSLWREVSKLITSAVFAVYVPLYSVQMDRLKETVFFDNLVRWLTMYEDILEILEKLTSGWMEKHKILSKIEDYVTSGGILSPDLKWLKNIITTI